MKKMMKTILSLALIAVLALSLVACGSKTPEGRYAIKTVKADGQEQSVEDAVEALGLDPEDMYFEFNEDGTGTLSYLGMVGEFTWEENVIEANGQQMNFEVSGSTLTVENAGAELICKK